MRTFPVLLGLAMLVSVLASLSCAAAEPDLSAQLAAKKISIEEVAAKVGNYPQALAEMEKARVSLKNAEQAYDKGRQWMGLRGLKPEAEQEVRHHLQMVDMASSLAVFRAAKGRNDEELAAVDKQLATVKARVKLLEERKAEEERLRQSLQKCEAAAKESAAQKTDAAKQAAQVEQLTADKKKLEEQVTALTSEKATLAGQLDTLKKQAIPSAPNQSAPQQSVPAK